MTSPLLGRPGPEELADVLRAVLRDWAADGQLSDRVLTRIHSLLTRLAVGEPSLPIPVPPADARPLMAPERPRLPPRADTVEGLSPEETQFLKEFARNGVASRRVWRIVVFACGGIAAIAGAVAAVIGLARAIGPTH